MLTAIISDVIDRYRRPIRFAAVGVIGFAVDAAVLYILLISALAGPITGRALSVSAAMTTTWLLNRSFTFNAGTSPTLAEGVGYALIKGVGLALNFGVYALLVFGSPFNAYPVGAAAIATLAATSLNFTMLKTFLFRGQPGASVAPTDPETPAGRRI
ncbi:MAG: hypothetical protein Kow00133_04160 [Amphiplicatus sp.]